MPQFSNKPPANPDRHGFRLIRTPANAPLRAYVISEALIGCPTHYVGNRTIPCESPDCEPCENGLAWRWHGYLLIQLENTSEVCIFEMTASAAESFAGYHQRHGTTRGCHFQASRVNNRPNGRVLVVAKPADLAKIHLPKPRDVRKLLCHIWNIPPNQTDVDAPHTRPPHLSLHTDRTKPEFEPEIDKFGLAAEQPDTGPPANGNGRQPTPPKPVA